MEDNVARDSDHGGIAWNTSQHDRSGADARVVSNLDVAENSGTRADHDAIPNRRMPLPGVLAGAAERDALINSDLVADDRSLADHHTHTVIDKKAFANLSARMDLDSRSQPRHLRKPTRQHSHVMRLQPMIGTIEPQRVQSRVAQQDLEH